MLPANRLRSFKTPPPLLLLLLLLLPANAELENERNGDCNEGNDTADTTRSCRIFPRRDSHGDETKLREERHAAEMRNNERDTATTIRNRGCLRKANKQTARARVKFFEVLLRAL